MTKLNPAAADAVHYATDPRIRHLAEAAWRMRTGGSRTDWLMLGKDNPEALIADAREWVRAAVASGLLPEPSGSEWKTAAHRAADADETDSGQPAPAGQTALRDRIAAALLARIKRATVSKAQPYDGLTSLLAANEFDLADAVLAELPPPADRAAVLREAAAWVLDADHLPFVSPMGRKDVAALLRRLAAEAPSDTERQA